jgi:hypothetical protein
VGIREERDTASVAVMLCLRQDHRNMKNLEIIVGFFHSSQTSGDLYGKFGLPTRGEGGSDKRKHLEHGHGSERVDNISTKNTCRRKIKYTTESFFINTKKKIKTAFLFRIIVTITDRRKIITTRL